MGIFKRMSRMCQKVSGGDASVKLAFRQKDGLDFFADDFNNLIEALKKSESAEKED